LTRKLSVSLCVFRAPLRTGAIGHHQAGALEGWLQAPGARLAVACHNAAAIASHEAARFSVAPLTVRRGLNPAGSGCRPVETGHRHLLLTMHPTLAVAMDCD
jgi:hypothetical protein